ncbi:MAG: biotin synthase BioB [Paraclostridium sp.]|uniref:biotin synthase BioB n=1 Tax=Paraclostridium sp. TaxID=2023273 RepID=UPI003F3AB072
MLYRMCEMIKGGYKINKQEAIELLNYKTDELANCADNIRKYFLEKNFDTCSIVNGKSGKCSEDCKFCSQSAFHKTDIDIYPLLSQEQFLKDAKHHFEKGVKRYSIVTSGKKLNNIELKNICRSYNAIKNEVGIKVCASHGLLDKHELKQLKLSGVERYHNNLETSRNFFNKICTTHTYEDKIKTIKAAQNIGLEVCSGGIIGLGESEIDRIDMAFELRDLNIKSIPINILNYIEGTNIKLERPITEDDVLKTVAIFRFINPNSYIRLAGGRNLLTNYGELAFQSGANATITGDLLTTCGNNIDNDMKMIKSLGFDI